MAGARSLRVALAVLALAAAAVAVHGVPVSHRRQLELDATERDPKPIFDAAATPAVLAQTAAAATTASAADAATTVATDPNPATAKRGSEWAVKFVRARDAALALPQDRLTGKEQLLSSNAFVFFRATPALFHSDLAIAKAHKDRFLLNPTRDSPPLTIGGDIHVANFGSFRSKSGDAVFGVNDYDQSGDGVADADLTRLATSAVLAARNLKLTAADEAGLVVKLGREYFEELHELAAAKGKGKDPFIAAEKAKGPVKDLLAKAAKRKRGEFLDKYATPSGRNARRFTRSAEIVDVADAAVAAAVRNLLTAKYKLVVQDVVEKLGSGGSSYGLPRYWAMVQNPKDETKQPLIVELKYLLPPALLRGDVKAKADGPKLLAAQKLLGGYHNALTDVTNALDTAKSWYLIREVEPEKDSVKLDRLSAADLATYVGQCGKVLARVHTQGGSKALAAALAKWIAPADAPAAINRLKEFATFYADQVAADHGAYKKAVAAAPKAAAK